MQKTYNADGTEANLTPDPNAEVVAEVGGGFDETSVTLSVFPKDIDRQRVTELLGVEPTKAWILMNDIQSVSMAEQELWIGASGISKVTVIQMPSL